MSKTTLIVVPCYNEAARLRPASFLEALRARPWLRLRFVDDGSVDDTPRLLEELRSKAPATIEVLRCPKNVGKAEAVRCGVLAGMHESVRFFGYWDADLSTPLDELDAMVERMEGDEALELVMASRVKLLGREIHRRALRHVAGRIFATAASLTLDLPVYDTQCGAKLLRHTDTTLGAFQQPFVSRWIFDVELIARLTRGADSGRVVEHPLRRWTDVPDSRMTAGHMARAAVDLARIYALYPPKTSA